MTAPPTLGAMPQTWDPDGAPRLGGMSRRSALTGGSAVAVGAAVLGTAAIGSAIPGESKQTTGPRPALPETALITLGVVAGPPPKPNSYGISSVLKIGSDLYLVDCGLGSLNAFSNAGLHVSNLKSMFITHLHADHIVDYYNFFISGGFSTRLDREPIAVYGPGPAGGLPPSELGDPDPATVAIADPTPGLAAATDLLHRAFAYSSNIFVRDYGIVSVEDLVKVTEIAVPPGSGYLNRSPDMDPFFVMSDDNVTVTATLVPHYDVYPAFGFRFDLKKSGVSVTFSGDTTRSDNLIRLAQNTDVLVHEAMFSLDDSYWRGNFPPNYLRNSHTSAEEVGEVAAAAKARHLILSHYSPLDLPDAEWLKEIGKNFSGKTSIAKDGQIFIL